MFLFEKYISHRELTHDDTMQYNVSVLEAIRIFRHVVFPKTWRYLEVFAEFHERSQQSMVA